MGGGREMSTRVRVIVVLSVVVATLLWACRGGLVLNGLWNEVFGR